MKIDILGLEEKVITRINSSIEGLETINDYLASADIPEDFSRLGSIKNEQNNVTNLISDLNDVIFWCNGKIVDLATCEKNIESILDLINFCFPDCTNKDTLIQKMLKSQGIDMKDMTYEKRGEVYLYLGKSSDPENPGEEYYHYNRVTGKYELVTGNIVSSIHSKIQQGPVTMVQLELQKDIYVIGSYRTIETEDYLKYFNGSSNQPDEVNNKDVRVFWDSDPRGTNRIKRIIRIVL